MRFTPDKLEVSFIDPVTLYNPINGRMYTLTHSDDTGVLFLTIGIEYDYDAINQDLRDEVLGTILQYRMEENLPTLFTSNLTIKELETHLSTTNKDIDKLKARRIIERIKQLTINITMISENKRKWGYYE